MSPSQFEIGWQPPAPQSQNVPGLESRMDPLPVVDEVPTWNGKATKYKGANKLLDRKAFITGGDSGIGRAVAVLFAIEGADSFIVYLSEEQSDAEQTKRMVESYGRKCYLHATDLKSKDNCRKAVDEALSKLGSINILVNNAAYQMMTDSILELSEEQWVHTFDTNIHPYFYLAKYVLPHMKQGDTIINNASVNCYVGRPDLLDYTSSKGAIVAFTRGLSNQFVGKGIRVNAVAPGPVWTPLIVATMTEEAQKGFTSPMGRGAQPSEIATCFVFLASNDSSQLSGQTIHCNGGVIVNG
ncbi:hypothetical protein B0A48_17432 [Cryoendolithus antarcticus]|uniref:Oxidoreductase n=1 Tax=Cryoendolithus antarcticus TaxID=1507870 RepID=A0A1V8SCF4_9PEZI|nr:hypothetical protein B0A48_17432 [Cryoendolithus antarcticus]